MFLKRSLKGKKETATTKKKHILVWAGGLKGNRKVKVEQTKEIVSFREIPN